MPRNKEKDIHEELHRRERILACGFKLFSEQGIENVSMNAVANAAGVGPTTLFKYYQTKEKLVISISGMVWGEVWQDVLSSIGEERYSELTALEMIRVYTDQIITLYQTRPEVLRFSSDYKTFICRQHTKTEELEPHLAPIQGIQTYFHAAYLRARTDGSIRTDISEGLLCTAVAVGMLATAERYAQGIVWTNRGGEDHLEELRVTREMILNWCAAGNWVMEHSMASISES